MRFPGRISPGLIEVPVPRSRLRLSLPNFPGESARASLKFAAPRHRAQPRSDFPGESARASLKFACESGELRFLNADFPGESARASLKWQVRQRLCLPHRAISRANQPGPH